MTALMKLFMRSLIIDRNSDNLYSQTCKLFPQRSKRLCLQSTPRSIVCWIEVQNSFFRFAQNRLEALEFADSIRMNYLIHGCSHT